MVEQVPARIWSQWKAFDKVEPFGFRAMWNMQAGVLQRIIAAFTLKGRSVPSIEDLLPARMVGRGVAQTGNEMLQKLVGAAPEGGVVRKRDAETEKRKAEVREARAKYAQRRAIARAQDAWTRTRKFWEKTGK